jgi:hypothetical protein
MLSAMIRLKARPYQENTEESRGDFHDTEELSSYRCPIPTRTSRRSFPASTGAWVADPLFLITKNGSYVSVSSH